ncbi:MAG: TonB C-terminal domain-containing protein [Rhodocyclaceae bacterium]|nr:TonB C-terminal domain-containing protein [Rhodocyclaceae bacterium]
MPQNPLQPGAPEALAERPGLSGLLALLVHAVFLGLMIFAVSWQTRPVPVVAEIWDALPGPPSPPRLQPKPRAEPVPKQTPPAPAPPPPPVVPKTDAAKPPVPQVKPVPTPPPRQPTRPEPKADIALEAEKQKQLAEAEARHQRELAEAARRDEEARREVEAARAAQAAAAATAEQQRQRELQRQREQQEAQAAAQQAQAARQSAREAYLAAIELEIRRRVVRPPGVQGNLQADIKVLQTRSGVVADSRIIKSSGLALVDEACLRAVPNALPLPSDPAVFNADLVIRCRPLD